MLIYIENKELLTKILSYLDYINKDYTLDINGNYEYVLIADINKKSIEISKNKKVILITYLFEEKIYRVFTKNNKQNREFKNRLINNINNFYKVIVSIEPIKKILETKTNTEIVTINKELPTINMGNTKYIYDIYKIKKRRKNILYIDFNYEGLNNLNLIAQKYPKLNFIYLGFKPYYNMTKREKNLYLNLPNNIYKVKYVDFDVFCDLLKISDIVINESNILFDIKYLYAILILKKKYLSKNLSYEILIDNKHIYMYENSKELIIKFNKIYEERLADISINAYDLVINNTFFQIVKKYSIYLP